MDGDKDNSTPPRTIAFNIIIMSIWIVIVPVLLPFLYSAVQLFWPEPSTNDHPAVCGKFIICTHIVCPCPAALLNAPALDLLIVTEISHLSCAPVGSLIPSLLLLLLFSGVRLAFIIGMARQECFNLRG